MLTPDGRTDGRTTDGRTTDDGQVGIGKAPLPDGTAELKRSNLKVQLLNNEMIQPNASNDDIPKKLHNKQDTVVYKMSRALEYCREMIFSFFCSKWLPAAILDVRN